MMLSELKAKLSKSIEFLKSDLAQIRTGRASPALIENLYIEAYDSKMSIKELGTITVLDAQNLVVSPWDKSLLKAIAKGIREGGMGLNPIDESDRVRVPVPPLTEERRHDFIKMVSSKVEECKNSLRSIRQEAMKEIDKAFTDKEISEDEKFSKKEEIEKTVKSFTEEADSVGDLKKEELLRV